MSSDARSSPRVKSLERLMYGLLIGASAVNLGANLLLDVMSPAPGAELANVLRLLLILSKPLLVPALAGILFLSTRGAASSIRRGFFYAALFFCWLGDLALLSTAERFFFLGLGSFGVAHGFFIRSYLVLDRRALQWSSVAYGLPFIVYGYTLYSILYSQLMDPGTPHKSPLVQALAIAGYMVVLLSNGVTGALRLRLKSEQSRDTGLSSSASILIGIVLFVQSDSIIAVTQYVDTLPLEHFAIMATYILGLFLMVRGCILDAQESTLQRQQSVAQPVPLAAAA